MIRDAIGFAETHYIGIRLHQVREHRTVNAPTLNLFLQPTASISVFCTATEKKTALLMLTERGVAVDANSTSTAGAKRPDIFSYLFTRGGSLRQ